MPAGAMGELSSPGSTLCADSYSVSIPTHVTAVACKRPWSFCQKCRWQVTPKHAYTLDPSKWEWADYAAVQVECGNLSGNKLTHNSSGKTWSQSSQLADPLWTDPGLKSEISLRELISTLTTTTKVQAGNELSNILPKSLHTRKKPPPPPEVDFRCVEALAKVVTLIHQGLAAEPCV